MEDLEKAISVLVPPSFLYGFIAGSIGYFFCQDLSHFLTSRLGTASFRQKIGALSAGKSYYFHSRLPSTVHALVQVIGTYATVLYGHPGYDDALEDGESAVLAFDDRTWAPTFGPSPFGPCVLMGVFVGYLVADVVAAPSFKDMEYVYVLHHAAAAICWTYCAHHRIMQPLATLLQFCELSTLVMNARQILIYSGRGPSERPVLIVNLLFFFTFGAVRVAPIPYVVRAWATRDFAVVRDKVGMYGAVQQSFFVAMHVALQGMWFAVMCQKFAQIIFGGMRKQKPKKV